MGWNHYSHSSATFARTFLPFAVLVIVTNLPQCAPPATCGVFIATMSAESGLRAPHEPATPFCVNQVPLPEKEAEVENWTADDLGAAFLTHFEPDLE